jgi:hypothetical protein
MAQVQEASHVGELALFSHRIADQNSNWLNFNSRRQWQIEPSYLQVRRISTGASSGRFACIHVDDAAWPLIPT